MGAAIEDSIAAGRQALLRAAWAEARSCFDAALAVEETVEALEGLGTAARWQMDGMHALAAHERAYRLAREAGDDAAAARLAIEGLALVADGAVTEGMRRLDEAVTAAVSGGVTTSAASSRGIVGWERRGRRLRHGPLADGSDLGGSIRIPRACCGVVGFKPSI